MFKISKKISYLSVLFAIIILSALLRIYKLSDESLIYDEMATLNVVTKSILEIIVHRDIHPPLYYFILHFWIELFGDSEFSIRFPSVIFGILSVYVTYKLGKLVFNDEVGILSAFFLSISLFNILYSQTARFYSLLALMILLSNYYFIKILEEKHTRSDTARYIISTILMLYTHGFSVFYIIVQNIYYLLFKKNIRYWLAVQGIILLIFIPWLKNIIWRLTAIGVGGGGLAWVPQPTFIDLYKLFRFMAGVSDIGIYLFIFVCIADLFIVIKDQQIDNHQQTDNRAENSIINLKDTFKYRIFLFLWLIVPVAMSFLISIIFEPIYLNRYVIGSLSPFLLLISKGISNFRRYTMALIPVLILVFILPSIPTIETYYNVTDQEQYREVANYIDMNKKDGEVVLLYVSNVKIPFSYYFKNGSNIPVLDSIYHSGRYSIKINMPDKTNGKSGYITSDKIEVKPLHNYTFSAWSNVKNGGGKNAPAIRIVELDKEGKNLKTTNVILNYETSGWIQKNKTFQTDNSTYWTYIMANIWDGYGTFWIDDISLKSDTNSQNLIKNPSFEDIDVSGVPINWNFIKKDLYFGVENTDQIDDLIKEKKGVWLVTSHVWSSKTKNELKLMKEILSKKYTNQSKINFVRIELFYYRE